MVAICGLANAHGGWVILGIAENDKHIGVKEGFALEYNSRPRSVDEVLRILVGNNLLLKFNPPIVPDALRYSMFPLANGRYVLVFNVEKTGGKYYYGREMYCRYNCVTKLVRSRA